jgi:hypothetical protein
VEAGGNGMVWREAGTLDAVVSLVYWKGFRLLFLHAKKEKKDKQISRGL